MPAPIIRPHIKPGGDLHPETEVRRKIIHPELRSFWEGNLGDYAGSLIIQL